MADLLEKLKGQLASIDAELLKLRAPLPPVERWRTDAKATLFHLRRRDGAPMLVLLGGTGTGKSTIVNRLIEAELTASSFRRTFTSGAVAIASSKSGVPEGWLGLEHVPHSENSPARGQVNALTVIRHSHPVTEAATIVDTPDLDGDQPAHHAEADRAFRWAEALLFLVTPEKYQMTELLPYYRLARRYGVPAWFVMNKCEEPAVLEDFRRQLAERDWPDARAFSVPRDDAAYEPPADADLAALRQSLVKHRAPADRSAGLHNRLRDLLDRLRDQVLAPARRRRQEVDRLIATLRVMTTPEPGVDVSPVTRQLQRRLQEQSVLYLMGPQRILDRVRQVPMLIARLPRTAWDFIKGDPVKLAEPQGPTMPGGAPDFPRLLADQFTLLHSRIDDLLRDSPEAQGMVHASNGAYAQVKASPADAARIAEEELAELKDWLQKRWDAKPRDTRVIQKMLGALPGGKHLAKWSEAAPYLLAAIVVAHHASGIPIDLIVFGSYSLATWLGEKISNEVTGRTRQANKRIADRFNALAREQVERVCAFLDSQATSHEHLTRIERMADTLSANLAGGKS